MDIKRKPEWLKISRQMGAHYGEVSNMVNSCRLHTICQSGKCPNMHECWSRGTATFMIMGDICTRTCKFCATNSGRPSPLDTKEPQHLAQSIEAMQLKHVVLTCVTRDDLPDQGARHWVDCITAVKQRCPQTTIEILTSDFFGNKDLIEKVAKAQPDIFAHNLEVVRRLTPAIRSRATYDNSLKTLQLIAATGIPAKTGIMAGLGENRQEVLDTMDDALAAGCTIFTIGQYLQPSRQQVPVEEYITPQQFDYYRQAALQKGFKHCESGPLVRSSYHAEEAAKTSIHKQ